MAKVFADVMLAKLARWLRFSGMKVYDAPVEDDVKLLRSVSDAKGVLLTSDDALFLRARKRRVRAVLIRAVKLERQIALVANSLDKKIKGGQKPSICPACNSDLARISRERASRLVPVNAYRKYRLFYLCRNCNKAYWQGTHWKEITERLKEASRLQKRI
jgi:uncharacterized protein with PIN domain